MSEIERQIEQLESLVKNSPNGLPASEIRKINPELLNAALDALEDKGKIRGKYEQFGKKWVYIYRWVEK